MFVLASQSPRRQQLLSMLGLTFDIVTADIDETMDPALTVEEAVEINKLGNYEYVQFIQSATGEISSSMDEESGIPLNTASADEEVDSEDATLPKEQEEEVKE